MNILLLIARNPAGNYHVLAHHHMHRAYGLCRFALVIENVDVLPNSGHAGIMPGDQNSAKDHPERKTYPVVRYDYSKLTELGMLGCGVFGKVTLVKDATTGTIALIPTRTADVIPICSSSCDPLSAFLSSSMLGSDLLLSDGVSVLADDDCGAQCPFLHHALIARCASLTEAEFTVQVRPHDLEVANGPSLLHPVFAFGAEGS